MKGWAQILSGLIAVLASGILILGSLLLTLTEKRNQPGNQPSVTGTLGGLDSESTSGAWLTTTPKPAIATRVPLVETTGLDITPDCTPLPGSIQYVVGEDDSLSGLALLFGLDEASLRQANCLSTGARLEHGMLINIPKSLLIDTGTACSPPSNWPIYVVLAGDTLFSIGQRVGASVAYLQSANCLGNSTRLSTGQLLKVPRLPSFPSATLTATQSARPISATGSATPTAPGLSIQTPSTTPSMVSGSETDTPSPSSESTAAGNPADGSPSTATPNPGRGAASPGSATFSGTSVMGIPVGQEVKNIKAVFLPQPSLEVSPITI